MKNNFVEILKLNSLKIGYGTTGNPKILLPPLTASAGRGELIAVIGRNGIGKSTLLRSIIGLQPLYGGTVVIDGTELSRYPRYDLAQKIGYISTEIVRVSNMTVYDLVALGRFPHTNWLGRIDHKSYNAILNALEITGIMPFRERYVSELSDGERQKAMIARVLAQDTDVMVMDEPTAFLDITGKFDIVSLMLKLTRGGRTVIFSTHDFNIALNQADKIWLILDENLLEGSPEDLILRGAFDHLFESSYVGFNPEDGSFNLHKEPAGTIFIEGEGRVRNWTSRAILRAGYSVSETKRFPCITIPSALNKKWEIITNDSSDSFESIYDLIRWLLNKNQDLL